MRRKFQQLLFIVLAILFSVTSLFALDPLSGFEYYAEQAMKDWNVPGMAIAIVKDDKVVFARGFGVLELGKPEKVDQNTVFGIGSNTKLFTSTSLGMLVQEGKLSWDDRILKYLPEFELYDPYVTQEFTLRDSLSHRSGIATWAGDLVAWGSRYNRAELLKRARYLKPSFPFRSGYGYCNLAFVAAGEVIPAVAGKSWDAFVKQRIFDLLKMSRSTTSVVSLDGMSNVAKPHTFAEGHVVVVPYRNLDNLAPAGSINSTVMDMAQWIRLQLNDGTFEGKRLVDESILEEIRTPQNPLKVSKATKALIPSRHFLSYGLGVGVSDLYGRLVLSHTGGVDGMLSRVVLLPEEKLGLVILTNHDDHSLDSALSFRIVDAFMGQPEKDWSKILHEQFQKQKKGAEKQQKILEQSRKQGTKPSMATSSYAGTYNNEHYGNITIQENNKVLVLKLDAHPGIQCHLEHWHYETFLCKWNDVEFGKSLVQFALNDRPEVSEVSFKIREDFLDPLEYRFSRIPPAK